MTILQCTPVYLLPKSRLRFKACSVRPGVRLEPFIGALASSITQLEAKLPVTPGFGPTHVVIVDEPAYEEALRLQLEAEDSRIPPGGRFLLDPDAIMRQVCVSLLISGGVGFHYAGHYSIRVTPKARAGRFRATAYAHRASVRVWDHVLYALQAAARPVGANRLRAVARAVDRYYRSGVWWSDRVAMSLNYLFSAASASYPDQAFVGLSTVLETLLTTSSNEITHLLAERCAILLESHPQKRKALYSEIKRLYAIRSRLVHGKVVAKRGRQTWESLSVTAKRANIPMSDMKSLVAIAIWLTRTVITDADLLSRFQAPGSEERTDKSINEYFAGRLFGG